MRYGINKVWPWFKVAVPIVLAFFAVLNFEGIFDNWAGEFEVVVPNAPMSRQVRVPDRMFRMSVVGKKLVALTFDDGPSATTTSRLLDILYEKAAIATFFELGSKMASNPEISQRVAEQGHEIGSHTMWHQNLIVVSRAAVREDIEKAKEVYREVLGKEVGIMRMPYGNSDGFVAEVVGVPLIYWTVDTRDWAVLNAQMVADNAVGAVFDGAIVLMHDIYDSTVDAVGVIIDELRAQGYEFVTVSELAKIRGVTMNGGETYYSFRP